jgi:hypothetical protein
MSRENHRSELRRRRKKRRGADNTPGIQWGAKETRAELGQRERAREEHD